MSWSGIFVALIVLVVSASCSRGVNAYVDGAVWDGVGESVFPTDEKYKVDYFIRGDTVNGDLTYLKLYESIGNVYSNCVEYLGALRSRNDKVYYLPKEYETEFIIFDFDIMPGERFQVYPGVHGYYGDEPEPLSMMCLSREKMVLCGIEYEKFYVVDTRYYDRNQVEHNTGIWIKGIGSFQGPIANNYMDMGGNNSEINRVIV